MKITIDVAFKLGQRVYIATDTEQLPYIISSIIIEADKTVLYRAASVHGDFVGAEYHFNTERDDELKLDL